MLQSAVQSVKRADVALLLIDVGSARDEADERVLAIVKDAKVPVVLGINKVDSRPKQEHPAPDR